MHRRCPLARLPIHPALANRVFGVVQARNAIAVLTAWLLLAGCENAEEKARYVKAPFEGADLGSRTSLDEATTEARTRLASVRGARLRADLSADVEGTYERALARIREREEAARQALENERRLQAERERALAAAAEAERKRAAEREPEPPDEQEEWERRRAAAVGEQRERARDAVAELEVGVRDSAFGDGSKVLVLRNVKSYPVHFHLRCFTAGGGVQKTFFLAMPPLGEKRIGFVQGWSGNFHGGERCEAHVERERLWDYTVP